MWIERRRRDRRREGTTHLLVFMTVDRASSKTIPKVYCWNMFVPIITYTRVDAVDRKVWNYRGYIIPFCLATADVVYTQLYVYPKHLHWNGRW